MKIVGLRMICLVRKRNGGVFRGMELERKLFGGGVV